MTDDMTPKREYEEKLAQMAKRDMNERRRLFFNFLRFVGLVLLALAVIASAAVLFVSIKNFYFLTDQKDGYYARAAGIERDMETKMDELNDKFAVERLNLFFSRDEIYTFSYNMWKYELLVNDQPVDDPMVLKLNIKEGDKLIIRESLRDTLLPADFINIGNLVRGDKNDAVKNHFALNGVTHYLEEKKEGFTTDYVVSGLEFTSGTKFEILLSVQLQERLGFENYLIDVTVT
ncbi:MAG: hypothetical protein GX345_00745 [Clostridiales bacterium]|mgnify:CR=1 FL=1|jgi:hypothetical protein|nr:hypothetical protein [Clostridiales bacterium]